ncbi:MAG: hypothetical protein OIN87_02430 [Candidatus Methanoperedens sp.]|nr:hypothetical protein [Candidatus Methanoperedens sp.]
MYTLRNIRKIIEKEIRQFVDHIRIDNMGNLIATKNGGSPSLMLAAHMDEIGLMAKYVDDKGFIYFTTTGGTKSGFTRANRCFHNSSLPRRHTSRS